MCIQYMFYTYLHIHVYTSHFYKYGYLHMQYIYTSMHITYILWSLYTYISIYIYIIGGVFMADMARFLIIYHYGGIYMDLDFYCHKPFSCLIDSLSSKYIPANTLASTNTNQSLFVVSLEPRVHGLLFRSKPRVVIQDFFLRYSICIYIYSVCMYVYIKCMYLVYI